MPEDIEKIPFSMDAEEAVLGSILIDGESINKVIDILEVKDFFYKDTEDIYESMISLRDRGESINQIIVGRELQRINKSGLVSYMSHCIAMTPTSLDIEHYAEIVRRCSFYRQLLGVSSQVAAIALGQDPNIKNTLDKCEGMIQELRQKVTTESRRLFLGEPRLIETNPPRYIWNVNGKDLRLTLSQITQWGKFKNVVISELNFVPIKPRDWDDVINALITHSTREEAPLDASEEQQLKILIQRWFDRMREASVYSDLSVGRYYPKEVRGTDYYFFKSTPLLDYLKKEYRRGINSEDLWVYVDKWRGIKHKIRVKHPARGSMPVDLWGIPMNFADVERENIKKMEVMKLDELYRQDEKPPEWF